MSYRDQFDDQEAARVYEYNEYNEYSHSTLLWRIEQRQLATIVNGLKNTHERVSFLDFATGTGRVLHFIEPLVSEATGLEISPAMAQIASCKAFSPVLCGDLTVDHDLAPGPYDLITAFRFILNAEPELRLEALKALRARLRDDSSLLIVNNHGNFWSHKIALWPIHMLRRGSRYHPEGNYLSNKGVGELFAQAGLQIVARLGCGVMPGRLGPHVSQELLFRGESHLSQTPIDRLGVNQMYVVSRQPLDLGSAT